MYKVASGFLTFALFFANSAFAQREPKEPTPRIYIGAAEEIDEPVAPEPPNMDNFEIKEPIAIDLMEPLEPIYKPKSENTDIYQPDLRLAPFKDPYPLK